MNETAVNNVITQYAIETANLRLTVANLQEEVNRLTQELEKTNKKEGE